MPVFFLILAILAFLSPLAFIKEAKQGITGFFAYTVPLEENREENFLQGYITEENTEEGLTIKYGQLKQGEARLGIPVKWEQELIIMNPTSLMENLTLKPELPSDARNINILGNQNISWNNGINIPKIEKNESLRLLLAFETSPVQIEFSEYPNPSRLSGFFNGPIKTVRVWHNSTLHYQNVKLEMDISLGEKIIEISNNEENIKFDYNNGKSVWIIRWV